MHETTTFFDAKRSRSQNNRRANSVPPALYGMTADDAPMGRSRSSQRRDSDMGDDAAYDSALESGLTERGRGRDRALPRSASALPGIHDSHGWHRDGFSRRPSYDADTSRPPSHSDDIPTLRRLNLNNERGPSPAYTPTVESATMARPGRLDTQGANRGYRESMLSPIQSAVPSAVPSRATSERDGSTETQNRRNASESRSPPPRLENVQERTIDMNDANPASTDTSPPSESDAEHGQISDSTTEVHSEDITPSREVSRNELDEEHGHAIRSILAGSASGSRAGSAGGTTRSRPSNGGEVRFAPNEHQDGSSRTGLRTDYHPAGSAIHAISAVSTAHNSPAPSRPQSVMAAESTDDLTLDTHDHEPVEAISNAPVVSSPLAANFSVPADGPEQALGRVSSESTRSTHSRRSNLSTRSNRSNLSLRSAAAHGAAGAINHGPTDNATSPTSHRSSLLRDTLSASNANAASSSSAGQSGTSTPAGTGISASSSTASLQEIRQGRKNRLGSHSTIVINTDPSVPPAPPIEAISSRQDSPRLGPSQSSNTGSTAARSSLSGPSGNGQHAASPYGHPQGFGDSGNSSSGAEDRGRKGTGRFSLAATLRGLSKDVKDRVRASSRSKSRAGFGSGHGSSADLSSYPGSGVASAGSGSSLRGRGVTPGGGRDGSSSRSRSTTRNRSGTGDGLPPPPLPSTRIERTPSQLGNGNGNGNGNGGVPQPDRIRAMRSGSFTRQDPDFVPPFGRGGAGRVNSASRERDGERSRSRPALRNDSPSGARRSGSQMGKIKEEEGKKGKRSESRGRGRNKGMKILTDALGLGDHGEEQQDQRDEGEGYRDEHGDVHNWKEFRKGEYLNICSQAVEVTPSLACEQDIETCGT